MCSRFLLLGFLLLQMAVRAAAEVRANYTVGIVMLNTSSSSVQVASFVTRDKPFLQGLLLFKQQLDEMGGISLDGTGASAVTAVDLQYEFAYVPANTAATTAAAEAFAANPNINALACSPNAGTQLCAAVAASAKMLFFSPYASDEMCSGPTDAWGNDYDYSYCPFLESNTYYQNIFYEAERLGFTKTAIYWAGYYAEIVDAATGVAEAAEQDYGLNVLFNVSYDAAPATYATDGTVIYNQDVLDMLIAARDADVELLVLIASSESVVLLEMLEYISYSPALLWMPVLAAYDTFPSLTGDRGNYVLATSQWYPTMTYSDPFFGDSATYASMFKAAYGEDASQWAAVGSLVGASIALAIQKGGDITLEKVNRGMGFINDETFYGLLKYGQFNRNIGRDPVTLQWIDGAMVFVLPSSIATGELVYPMEPWACRVEQKDRVCFEEVVGVSNSSQVAFSVISLIGIALLVLALIGVFRKQDSVIFNRASPLFCKLLIVFGIGGYVSCMLFAIEPTEGNGDVLCPGRIWVLAYASTGVLASLFAKTWRLYRLFTRQKTMRRQAITDQQLLGIMAVIFTGTTVLMIGWTADKNYRPHFEIVPEASNSDIGIATCSVDSPWLWVNITYFLLLNAWGAFLAYHVRKLPSSFNESKYIFFCLYNIFICIVVLLPIGAVMLKGTVNEDVTLCIGILFAFSSVMISIIGSKFLMLYVKDKESDLAELNMPSSDGTGEGTGGGGRASVSHPGGLSNNNSNNNRVKNSSSTGVSNARVAGPSSITPVMIMKEEEDVEREQSCKTFIGMESTRDLTDVMGEGGDDDDDHMGGNDGGGGGGDGGVMSSPGKVRLELAEAKEQLSVAVQKEVVLASKNKELEGKLAEYEMKLAFLQQLLVDEQEQRRAE